MVCNINIIMTQALNKKRIIMIFDALPYESFINYGFKFLPNNLKTKVIKLESLIGYSDGLFPSIWTGLYPDQTNYWSGFKFNCKSILTTKKSEKILNFDKILNLLGYLPKKLSQILSLALFLLKNKFNILPYNYPYPVFFDFKLKNFFNYQDYRKSIFTHPNQLKDRKNPSIFSVFQYNNISYKFIETTRFIDDFNEFKE